MNLTGTAIKGYTFQWHVASGGAGTVYHATQSFSRFERDVAIKVIHAAFVNQPTFIRRFEVEAQIVSRLEHPYIVPLYDFWRDQSGAYLVMRWMSGGSIASRLEQGALPPEESLRLLEQLAAALTLAHRRDVIHRDIKPGNVLLDNAGNAYLADFGIAKDVQSTNTTGPSAFTPGYAAPEQIMGGQITARADIYSLGVLIYQSGKSSLVRADLLPALRRDALPGSGRWFIVELIPGAHPLEELEVALLRVAVNPPPSLLEQLCADERGLLRAINRSLPADRAVELVLVIDQFEELFTLVEREPERAHLLESLLAAVCDPRSRVRVIVTLRADFFDRPLRYAAFGELTRRRTEVIFAADDRRT
jgi:serine/threonine protein kinase